MFPYKQNRLDMTKAYTLYSYYGSSCSQRIRIALALKGIKPEYKFVHLLKEEQHSEDYVSVNPSHSVPTLIISEDGNEIVTITQSLAIMEFLEETVTGATPLLPPISDPFARAKVRELADIVACDVCTRPLLCVVLFSRLHEKHQILVRQCAHRL